MLDYIKILVDCPKLIEYFFNTDKLHWKEDNRKLSKDKEVVHSSTVRTCQTADFVFRFNQLEIAIYPHYIFNDNLHNANEFRVKDCVMILKRFVAEFELENQLDKCKIVNLEYGINVIPPINCNQLVTCLSYHQRNEFVNDSNLKYSKKSYSVNTTGKANTYKLIKAYSKGVQFPQYCDIDTFRFEVKSKQSKFIKTLGIFTLLNLLNPTTYNSLKLSILKEWNDILILYSLNKLAPNKQKYLTSQFWYNQNQKSRNRFSYTKKEFQKTLDNSGFNIHKEMKVIISNKLNTL